MSTFLITGSSGQLGSTAIRRLLDGGHHVIALSHSISNTHDARIKRICWPLDESISAPNLPSGVDVVLHLGAQTSAYVARAAPARDVMENVTRFVALLEALQRQGSMPLVVLAGAATEVGASQSVVIDGLPLRPETFYDVAKVAQDLYLQQFEREGIVRGVNLKFTNIYGGSLSKSSSHRGFINRAVAAAVAGEDLYLYEGISGRRDFLHVEDAASALISICNSRDTLTRRDYVVGSGESIELRNALQIIAEIGNRHTGKNSQVKQIEPPDLLYPIELRDVQVDSSALREDTGWAPAIDFSSGIALMMTKP